MTDEQSHNQDSKPEEYVLGLDSLPQPGVPAGTIIQRQQTSRIYPGVVHDWWFHVPAQYDPARPACVMVYQDGQCYMNDCKVPTVMENLIHRGELPVTISIFIAPGCVPGAPPAPTLEESQRSIEYDTLSGRYASFLMEEILPEVAREYNLRTDAAGHGIGGISSGGICAFTVAWERPDAFSKVLSHCGSFTDIRGGHLYPSMVRRNDRKPIRVFLQTGTRDFDRIWGNWELANRTMASALTFKEYDYKLVVGHGAHDPWHGACILPETMKWLWRE